MLTKCIQTHSHLLAYLNRDLITVINYLDLQLAVCRQIYAGCLCDYPTEQMSIYASYFNIETSWVTAGQHLNVSCIIATQIACHPIAEGSCIAYEK